MALNTSGNLSAILYSLSVNLGAISQYHGRRLIPKRKSVNSPKKRAEHSYSSNLVFGLFPKQAFCVEEPTPEISSLVKAILDGPEPAVNVSVKPGPATSPLQRFQSRLIQTRHYRRRRGMGGKVESVGVGFVDKQHIAPQQNDHRTDSASAQNTDDGFLRTLQKHTDPKMQIDLLSAYKSGLFNLRNMNFRSDESTVKTWLIYVVTRVLIIVVVTYAFVKLVKISVVSGSDANDGVSGLFGGLNKWEINPEAVNVRFSDVKGVKEAKQEMADLVGFLRSPDKYTSIGGKLPRGVILSGPPGVGKTLLARAMAGEAGVPFFHVSGGDFEEVFVGTGARRVRQLFASAKQMAPCIVFIDEFECLGRKRISSPLHPYANQTVNQLLSEMDGFEKNEGVIVLGATNKADLLDKAVLRPGRFDVQIYIPPPDFGDRKQILEMYLSKVKTEEGLDLDAIAKLTGGFTGADIENLVNQACLKGANDDKSAISMDHLEWAMDKVKMGPARERMKDEQTNKITAYHEAGHALVAYYTPGSAYKLHKLTIIPHGRALGVTQSIPKHDSERNPTLAELKADLDTSMGGRIAEELVFGAEHITTGAYNDFQKATAVAKAMVTHFGMSSKVGPRIIHEGNSATVLGSAGESLAPQMHELVDQEIQALLLDSMDRARQILKAHRKELDDVADALLKYETIDADDFKVLVGGKADNLKPTKNKA